jgi:hypothetical protein
MNDRTLDPAVRRLLAAIDSALDGGWANRPAIRATIRSVLKFDDPADAADWLVGDDQATAAADGYRVRAADLAGVADLYQREERSA